MILGLATRDDIRRRYREEIAHLLSKVIMTKFVEVTCKVALVE